MSKVVLCLCGIVLMGAAVGSMDLIEDEVEDDGLQHLADEVASTLDLFWHSGIDAMVMPSSIIPSMGCTISVGDNIVTVSKDDVTTSSITEYPGSFTMGYGTDAEITRRTSPIS